MTTDEDAAARRARLRAMRADAGRADAAPGRPNADVTFRNYLPRDAALATARAPATTAPALATTRDGDDADARARLEPNVGDVDATMVAPKRANWDLKRDVDARTATLERRTRRALADIAREEAMAARGRETNDGGGMARGRATATGDGEATTTTTTTTTIFLERRARRAVLASMAPMMSVDGGAMVLTLPTFADDANRATAREIEARVRSVEAMKRECREHVKRTEVMREHVREVMKEMDGVRERARGARAALEREKHLALLDRANRQRAVSARARDEKRTTIQNERVDEYSRRAEAYERALRRLRLRAENADVVRDIARGRLADEERDLGTLREYEVEDERALKSLEAALTKVSHEVHKSQSDAEDAASTRAALVGELQRVQKSLKDAHARQIASNDELAKANITLSERQALIKRTMRVRDQTLSAVEDKHVDLRRLKETAQRIELLNKASQSKVTMKEQLLRRKTEKCQALKSELTSSTQALETATHMRLAAVRGAECARARRCEAEEMLKAHRNARDEKSRQVQKARCTLDEERAALMTSERCLQELQDSHDREESTLRDARIALESDKDVFLAVSKTLHDRQNSRCRLEIELNGAMMHSKNLREKEHASQAKILKQRELIYTTSLQLQHLARKTSRLEGVRSNEESEKLEALIESLKLELEERGREYVALLAETKENEHKVERTRSEMEARCTQTLNAAHAKSVLEVEAEGSEKHEQSVLDDMEDLQVELDELRLQLARRHRVLFLSSGQAKELADRKNKILCELETRYRSLSVEHTSLLAHLTTRQQDAHAAIMDSNHRKQRLEHLRSRYDVVRAKSPHGDGVAIEEQRDICAIIEKQRDDLAVEREELSGLIHFAECEVESMRRILEDAEQSNSSLRATLAHPANDTKGASREEWMKTEAALEKLQTQNNAMMRMRERDGELTNMLAKLKTTLANAVDEHNALSNEVDTAQRMHDSAMRKYKSQKSKLRRSRAAAASAVAAYRAALGLTSEDPATIAEQRVRVHQLKESIHKAAEIMHRSAPSQALKAVPDSDGSSIALSPTSSLTSFFTFASSTTRSSVMSVSSSVTSTSSSVIVTDA